MLLESFFSPAVRFLYFLVFVPFFLIFLSTVILKATKHKDISFPTLLHRIHDKTDSLTNKDGFQVGLAYLLATVVMIALNCVLAFSISPLVDIEVVFNLSRILACSLSIAIAVFALFYRKFSFGFPFILLGTISYNLVFILLFAVGVFIAKILGFISDEQVRYYLHAWIGFGDDNDDKPVKMDGVETDCDGNRVRKDL